MPISTPKALWTLYEISSELIQADICYAPRVGELSLHRERNTACRVITRELEVGDRHIGHVGHSREREILRSGKVRTTDSALNPTIRAYLDESELIGSDEAECLRLDALRLETPGEALLGN